MGVEYFKLALTCQDDRLSSRMLQGKAGVTNMLEVMRQGPFYMDLCFLEMLMSEWIAEVEQIEMRRAMWREPLPPPPRWWHKFWRK